MFLCRARCTFRLFELLKRYLSLTISLIVCKGIKVCSTCRFGIAGLHRNTELQGTNLSRPDCHPHDRDLDHIRHLLGELFNILEELMGNLLRWRLTRLGHRSGDKSLKNKNREHFSINGITWNRCLSLIRWHGFVETSQKTEQLKKLKAWFYILDLENILNTCCSLYMSGLVHLGWVLKTNFKRKNNLMLILFSFTQTRH